MFRSPSFRAMSGAPKYTAMKDAPEIPEILQQLGYDNDLDKEKLFEAIRPLFINLEIIPSRWAHPDDRECREVIANTFLRQKGVSFWLSETSSQKLQYPKDREK